MFPSEDCGWTLSCLLVANFSPLHRVSVSFLGHSGDDVNRSSPPVTPVTTEQSPESPETHGASEAEWRRSQSPWPPSE